MKPDNELVFNISIVVIMTIVVSIIYIPQMMEDNKMREASCSQFPEQKQECLRNYECFSWCVSQNYDYFRYDASGFGSKECWCNNNGTITQIW